MTDVLTPYERRLFDKFCPDGLDDKCVVDGRYLNDRGYEQQVLSMDVQLVLDYAARLVAASGGSVGTEQP